MVRWLNMAQRTLCSEGDIMMSSWTSSTVSNQEEYSVPSDFLMVRAIFIYNTTTGVKLKLRPIDLQQRDPTQQTGNPTKYFISGRNVSGVNSYTIGLNPIPSTSGSSDLIFYGRQQPATMVTGGTAPEILTPWQDYLIAYAAWCTYMRRGPDWLPMAREMWNIWQQGIRKAKDAVNPLIDDFPTTITDVMGYSQVYSS